MSSEFTPIDEVVAAAARGAIFVLFDDEHPEAGGDLVALAEFADAEAINFVAREGGGIIGVVMTPERVKELELKRMPSRSPTREGPLHTASVEASTGISTGISAKDRARTISVLVDDRSTGADLVSPGHVFPIIAEAGGVLAAPRGTEAAVDIARIAGAKPICVICKILDAQGMVAGLDDLADLAERLSLPITSVGAVVGWRSAHERLVEPTRNGQISSRWGGVFDVRCYRELRNGREHVAIVRRPADPAQPPIRLDHRMSWPADVLGLRDMPPSPIGPFMKRMAAESGGGALILMPEEISLADALLGETSVGPDQDMTPEQSAIAGQIFADIFGPR